MGPFRSKMERLQALHQVQFVQSLLEDKNLRIITSPQKSIANY